MNVGRLWQRRPLRYLLVGAGNTAFSYGVYCLCIWNGLGVALASAISLGLGVVASFASQSRIVFGGANCGAFVRFVGNWLLMYGLYLLVVLLLGRAGWGPYLAGGLATGCTTAASYFLLRDRVFRVGAAAAGDESS